MTTAANTRDERQQRLATWCVAAFGAEQARSVPQRGIRLAEEAIEAAQAAGCERQMLHKLVDFIYDRPVGEMHQELGGVSVAILALAAAAGLSAEGCEVIELDRVMSKPLDHWAARNALKNAAGFDTSATPAIPAASTPDYDRGLVAEMLRRYSSLVSSEGFDSRGHYLPASIDDQATYLEAAENADAARVATVCLGAAPGAVAEA